MLKDKIIRAWKDPEYRQNLSEEEREALPENPAGAIELTDEELDMAAGGSWRQSYSQSSRPSISSFKPDGCVRKLTRAPGTSLATIVSGGFSDVTS